jgi:hypothetical protein
MFVFVLCNIKLIERNEQKKNELKLFLNAKLIMSS